MNISVKAVIFKNEYNGKSFYTTSISNKNAEGKYEYMSIGATLLKGTDLPSGTVINIKKGFLSFYKDKNGLAQVKAIIQDFDFNEEIKEEQEIEQELPF